MVEALGLIHDPDEVEAESKTFLNQITMWVKPTEKKCPLEMYAAGNSLLIRNPNIGPVGKYSYGVGTMKLSRESVIDRLADSDIPEFCSNVVQKSKPIVTAQAKSIISLRNCYERESVFLIGRIDHITATGNRDAVRKGSFTLYDHTQHKVDISVFGQREDKLQVYILY